MTHTILTRLQIEEAMEEIIRSEKDIEERVGVPCRVPYTLFAYPNSKFNTKIIELLKENGLKGAVTTIPRMLTNQANLFMLNLITQGPISTVPSKLICLGCIQI